MHRRGLPPACVAGASLLRSSRSGSVGGRQADVRTAAPGRWGIARPCFERAPGAPPGERVGRQPPPRQRVRQARAHPRPLPARRSERRTPRAQRLEPVPRGVRRRERALRSGSSRGAAPPGRVETSAYGTPRASASRTVARSGASPSAGPTTSATSRPPSPRKRACTARPAAEAASTRARTGASGAAGAARAGRRRRKATRKGAGRTRMRTFRPRSRGYLPRSLTTPSDIAGTYVIRRTPMPRMTRNGTTCR